MRFLDANVIQCYLTRDHPDHSERAYAFLQRVETGEIEATITEAVLVSFDRDYDKIPSVAREEP